MKLAAPSASWCRIATDLALLTALGLFMGAVGPFDSDILPAARRYPYWCACIVGGGAIGIAIDETLGLRVGGLVPRIAATVAAMTPLVTAYVAWLNQMVFHQPLHVVISGLPWQVLVISALVMSIRALVWRSPRTVGRPAPSLRHPCRRPRPCSAAGFRRVVGPRACWLLRRTTIICSSTPTLGPNS